MNLNVGTDQPYFPGNKTKRHIGNSGQFINNADSEISRRMQVVNEEDVEEDEEVDEAITMAGGNISGIITPIGKEKHGRYKKKKNELSEKLIRRLIKESIKEILFK